ncbi:MAG TPA: Rpn family recombination-promoting nuclease/putative transposase [Planctomycetota bacterium]|nr:Rpn family recombination-promoting nuclease/putative transposase [Planctomycetota bacterium]
MQEPDPIHHPHDALFRAAFGDPERAAELLRSVLPADLVAAIDWRSLRRIDASFVDDALRASQADLLFTANIGTREVLIYLLLDHKSNDDRFCAFQLARYEVRIWEQFRREFPDATHLPPILPYVLHHGARQWRSPRDLRDLIDLDGLPQCLVDLQPQLPFVLDDLGDSDSEALQRRRLAVQALLPLLHLQQLRRKVATAALLAAWRHLYRRLIAEPGGQELVSSLIYYVTAVSNDDLDDLRIAYARISKPSEEQYMTAAEKLIQQGLVRGRQEGRQEGRLEGHTEVLLIQLGERFGSLPDAVVDRVRAGSPAELELWARRVLTAPMLALVFAP